MLSGMIYFFDRYRDNIMNKFIMNIKSYSVLLALYYLLFFLLIGYKFNELINCNLINSKVDNNFLLYLTNFNAFFYLCIGGMVSSSLVIKDILLTDRISSKVNIGFTIIAGAFLLVYFSMIMKYVFVQYSIIM